MDERFIYEFGIFQVDPTERALRKSGDLVLLPPKALQTLIYLVERHGLVVSKSELVSALWSGVFVEENNLNQHISTLRKCFGDSRSDSSYIQTVPRQGYRFCYPVKRKLLEVPDVQHKLGAAAAGERSQHTASSNNPATFRRLSGRAAGVVAFLVCAALGVTLYRRWFPPSIATADDVHLTVAVLPYEVAGKDDSDHGTGAALADDLARQLHGRNEVVTFLPAQGFAGLSASMPPGTLAKQLKADFALTASLEVKAEKATIRVKLVDLRSGETVLSRSANGTAADVFSIQDAARADLIPVVSKQRNVYEARDAHITRNLDAYSDYMRGLSLWNERTAEGLYRSIDLLEQATERDPHFAVAYVALANAYAFDIKQWPKAERSARKALALDAELGEAHASLGFVQMFWKNDYESAAEEFKTSIRLSPHYAPGHQWYADNLAMQSRVEEAISEMRSAQDIDPYSEPIRADMARMYYLSHHFDKAKAECAIALEQNEDFLPAHIRLYDIELQTHEYDKAVAEFSRIEDLAGNSGLYHAGEAASLKAAYAKDGIKGFLRERARFLSSEYPDAYEEAKDLALLGDKEAAMASLKSAIALRDQGKANILFAGDEPAFDSIRSDPRFFRLIRGHAP